VSDPSGEISKYLDRLPGSDWENAWHALAEIGAVALPAATAALAGTGDAAVRVALIRLLAAYRSPDAIPAVASQLGDTAPAVWQAALDALVAIGTEQALAALTAARAVAPMDRRQWIDEALGQIEAGGTSAG
jgi:HEAT repeat protein